ncbi:MAG: hypothetical protein KBT00_03870 [Bacteroidales bacterium]|nr:hypothetical protein [Candidatus Cacconaster merdequi]
MLEKKVYCAPEISVTDCNPGEPFLQMSSLFITVEFDPDLQDYVYSELQVDL